jgi:hypothetical protein
MFTQADWVEGSGARRKLFDFVCQKLNDISPGFEVQDGVTGPLIRHIPSNVAVGVRPTLPANSLKPFYIHCRLTRKFPVKADGTFNADLLVQRVLEVEELFGEVES